MTAMQKIGVMGAVGSFSEKAGELYLAEYANVPGTVVPLISAAALLTALEAGSIERAIFPIENSNGGIVLEAVEAMAAHRFTIERMFELDVHHMLLIKPDVSLDAITQVASHDQALKQCRIYLRRRWPEASIEPYIDTAQAAADLASGVLPATTAVIAPRRCAEIYGLTIAEESVQDLKFNYTRFVVATP